MTVLVLTKMATNWPVKEKQYELILKKKKKERETATLTHDQQVDR